MVNIDKLPQEVQKKFVPFAQSLLKIHSDRIVSIFVYGSSAGANYVPKVSDVNSVFVFDEFSFDVFEKSLKTVSAGIKKRIAAPLFLTRSYIESSLDVFPIEFLDMKENHVLVYGEDILSSLEIGQEHIRLFCEQQIKGKLIRIRQAYLEVGLAVKGMEALLKESLNSLIPVFRNLIRLKGVNPAVPKEEIIRQFCQAFDLDENVFLPICRDQRDDERIAGQHVKVFLEKFIQQLMDLSAKVDQL